MPEQAARLGRGHQGHDAVAAGRLPEHRDLGGVAAEGRHVALDPAQGRRHVEQAVVARAAARLGAQFRMCHEAEGPEAVVDRDQHHALLREIAAHEDRVGRGALLEGAAMDPDHDRQCLVGRCRRGPQVQAEAVLAHRLDAREFRVDRIGGAARLHALRCETVGPAHAVPGQHRCRRPPAQRAHRRRREGHAQVGAHAGGGVAHAGQQPAVDAHGPCLRHGGMRSHRLLRIVAHQAKALAFLPSSCIGTR